MKLTEHRNHRDYGQWMIAARWAADDLRRIGKIVETHIELAIALTTLYASLLGADTTPEGGDSP